jgi:hypothetical protein
MRLRCCARLKGANGHQRSALWVPACWATSAALPVCYLHSFVLPPPSCIVPSSRPLRSLPAHPDGQELPEGVTTAPRAQPPRTYGLPPRPPGAPKAAAAAAHLSGAKRAAPSASGAAGGEPAVKSARQKHNEAVKRDAKAAEVRSSHQQPGALSLRAPCFVAACRPAAASAAAPQAPACHGKRRTACIESLRPYPHAQRATQTLPTAGQALRVAGAAPGCLGAVRDAAGAWGGGRPAKLRARLRARDPFV